MSDDRPDRIPPSEIRISFAKRTDKAGKTYYLARPRLPVSVDLSNAAIFFWPHDEAMTVRFEREKRVVEDDVPKGGMVDWDNP